MRRSGTFQGLATEEVMNNGVAVRTPMRFTIGNDHSFTIWGQNRSGSNLAGGTTIVCDGILYGRWRR